MDLNWLNVVSPPITDPSRRMYWVFLVAAVLCIFILWLQQGKRVTWQRIAKTFFSRRYWFNASTRVDYALFVVNGVIRSLLLIPLFGSHLLGAIAVGRFLQANLDSAPALNLPWLVIAASFTVVFFLVEDLSRFLLHRCMHRYRFLWRFHRVHHSAQILTPITLYRVHPVEMAIYYTRGFIVFSLVSGVFIYLAGRQLSAFHILGVDALGFLFNAVAANLRHSHIWLSFGRFERWFISPAQHQLHHSVDRQHQNLNYGTCLAVWDKIAGSWRAAGRRRALRFGLSAD